MTKVIEKSGNFIGPVIALLAAAAAGLITLGAAFPALFSGIA